eukprot:TRINITY_DN236_c0_g1_i1.p1 TRINITY_DN236_c0_g1~~TRINITY_DN236_c0_g1_i1.p1  ORF type:complete len:556 (-),score=131.06 TRINITY_DN236_c0_g1_i1:91-1758(-)
MNQRVVFTLIIAAVCALALPLSDRRTDESRLSEPLRGFADLHVHQFGEMAFAGAWFAKGKDGAWTYEGEESVALHSCSGNVGGDDQNGDHAVAILENISDLIGLQPGSTGDTGSHPNKTFGWSEDPQQSYGRLSTLGWPRWDTIAHQQVWEGHLYQAYRSGLSLMMMSAVDFYELCRLTPVANRRRGFTCEEMSNINKQLDAAISFVRRRDWLEIALSPQDIRRIVGSGKLAIILAIEVSDVFVTRDNTPWETQLQKYYDMGVRSIMPLHQLNNPFGGAALHNPMFQVFQALRPEGPFQVDEQGRNLKGMTDEGKRLMNAMMDLNMLIDIAHISERGVEDVVDLSVARNYYPFFVSHGHLRSIMTDKKSGEEKTSPDWVLKALRQSGGIFGLRTGALETKRFPNSIVPNDCDGSSKSFAQALEYGERGLNASIAFASDLNGFIQQVRPRFGNRNETCGASGDKEKALSQQQLQDQGSRLGTDFDHAGLGHIGLLNDLLMDVKNYGYRPSSIDSSTELFVKMWERCFDTRRTGPLPTEGFIPLDPNNKSPSGRYSA